MMAKRLARYDVEIKRGDGNFGPSLLPPSLRCFQHDR